jgi:hypothetical protein
LAYQGQYHPRKSGNAAQNEEQAMPSDMSAAETGNPAMRWITAFIAGFLAVLIFHQPMLSLLASMQITQAVPYSFKPVAPLGMPQFLSAAFWGGIWGMVFYFVSRRWRYDYSYWLKAFAFGMIFPTLVAWFVAAPLKGLPMAAGGKFNGMLTGLAVNAAWGLGTAILLRLSAQWFEHRGSASRIS